MSAALGDYDSLDGRCAFGAGLVFAAVYIVEVLEASFATVGVDVVGDGGAAVMDGFLQCCLDGFVETQGACAGDGCRGDCRMNTGAEQRFIDVDVSKTREERLVQKQRFDARGALAQGGDEVGCGHR